MDPSPREKKLLDEMDKAKSACIANPLDADNWKKRGNLLTQLALLSIDGKHLKGAINFLKVASRLNPNDAETFNLLGIAHYFSLEMDPSVYYLDSALFEKFCRDGMTHFKKFMYMAHGDPKFRHMVDGFHRVCEYICNIVKLAGKRGICISLWEAEDEENRIAPRNDENNPEAEDEKKRIAPRNEENNPENLKKAALALLKSSGSRKSLNERIQTIADAIQKLDQVSPVFPEVANKGMERAYDLILLECITHKVESSKPAKGKGEASLPTRAKCQGSKGGERAHK